MNAKAFVIPAIFRAIDDFSRPIRTMQRNISNLERSMRRASMWSNNMYKGLGGNYATLGLSAGLYGVAEGFRLITKEAANAELTIAKFTPMMGSATKAAELFKQLQKTAMTTPFEIPELSQATSHLLPTTKGNIPETIKTLRMMGDLAGGSTEALIELSRNYTQIMGQGKGNLKDINQFSTWGVQIWQGLSKTTGKTEKELRKMQEMGLLTADTIRRALVDMTSAGGPYYRAMELSNQSLIGQHTNLKDAIRLTAQTIGMGLIPDLKAYIKEAFGITTSVKEWAIQNRELISQNVRGWLNNIVTAVRFVVNNFQTIISVLKIWAISLITAKVLTLSLSLAIKTVQAATFLYSAAIGINSVLLGYSSIALKSNRVALIAQQATLFLVTNAMKAVVAIQTAWNAVSLTTLAFLPMIGVAVMGAFMIYSKYAKATKELTAEQKIQSDFARKLKNDFADQRTEIKFLFKDLRQYNSVAEEHKKAISRLEELLPGITQKYNLMATGVLTVVQANKNLISAEAEVTAALFKEQKKRSLLEAYGQAYKATLKPFDNSQYSGLERFLGFQSMDARKIPDAYKAMHQYEKMYNKITGTNINGEITINNNTDSQVTSNSPNITVKNILPRTYNAMGF